MTTAFATLDRTIPTVSTIFGVRVLTMEEIAWVSGSDCDADICITITVRGLSSIDWGDALAWGIGGGLVIGWLGAAAGAGASILSDLIDITVESGNS